MTDNSRTPVAMALVALLAIIGIGAALIGAWVASERQRELAQWEARLGLVADGKADAIARLLAGERAALAELAGNASLQLYLWQAVERRASGADAAIGYLRNLLLATADRGGYLPPLEGTIPANLPRSAASGLALVDARLTPVVATPGLANVAELYAGFLAQALAAGPSGSSALLLDAQERPVLVLALPVGRPPGTSAAGSGQPLGLLLAVRSAEQDLLPLLLRGPSFAEASESLLLAARDGSALYLSPTRDGSGALRRSLPLDRPRLAEAAAVTAPGGFVQGDNYLGQPVLQASRRIRGQDWVLAQQVDADQALAVANERRNLMLAALSLLLLLVAASVIAAWRHGSSVKARQQAGALAAKAAELQRQTGLLHTIADSIESVTLLAAADGTLLFANRAAAQAVQTRHGDLPGKAVDRVLPPEAARELLRLASAARSAGQARHELLQLDLAAGRRDYQACCVPIAQLGDERQLALLVLNDVSELRAIEDRHTTLLRRLVTVLAHVVDQRDPYAAEHTARIKLVAGALASELELDQQERENLDLAATLANIGKIMIPGELLTKKTPLTAAEQDLLRRHVEFTLELLKGVDFDGPVLDIIAQKQERLDGSGYPQGLTEQQLSMAGRILSVANAFVALVSARAWREGIPVQQALELLLAEAGTRYDRRVIAALFHVAENRLDWSQWHQPDLR
jgi:HD-GYP domain-containing protein (c-di-GMP phosphodiesterase class II)